MRLALLIRNALNSPSADQHERLCRLNLQMQKVVTNIRKLPGLSCFFLPSLFPDLQRVASEGPVIIVNAIAVTRSSSSSIVILFIFPCRSLGKVF
jgi:hypothetical protein